MTEPGEVTEPATLPSAAHLPTLDRSGRPAEATEPFLAALRPLLATNGAVAAWVFGSHATGSAGPESDIDVIVVAPSELPFVERPKDYLPAMLVASRGVDLLVYTPEEFERLRAEERPFLMRALATAKPIRWD